MRTQVLFLEYVLLIILSVFLLFQAVEWFYNYRDEMFSSYLFYSNKINEKILSYLIGGIDFYTNTSVVIELKNTFSHCNGPLLIIESKLKCQSNPNYTSFTGYIVPVNENIYWVYSNKTNSYFMAVKINNNLLRSCYNSRISYIINTSNCSIPGICEGCPVVISGSTQLIASIKND